MRQLCLPILHHYHALHIGTEADNLIVVFRDAVGAARAAYEMQHVLQAYRYSLDADRSHFNQIPPRIIEDGDAFRWLGMLMIDSEEGMLDGYFLVRTEEGLIHAEISEMAMTVGPMIYT